MTTAITNIREKGLGSFAIQAMEQIVDEKYKTHPFSYGVSLKNAEKLLGDYLAMSKAFPYLAAGAQCSLILNSIEKNADIPESVEITSVVSNFLSWDETGGHAMMMRYGNSGLPQILNTRENFHANQLQKDLHNLFGKTIAPNFSDITKAYLKDLLENLSHDDLYVRAGTLAAFEMHAEQMITALWASLAELFNVDKDKLVYFRVHVGGDDPAEQYHVAMTKKMLDGILESKPDDWEQSFLEIFEKAYKANYDWCQQIKERL